MLRERLYMENLFKNPKLEVANVKGTDMAWAGAPHRWHSPILQNHHHCPPGRTKKSWKGEERASEVDVPMGRDCFLIKLVPLASELLPGHTTDPCHFRAHGAPLATGTRSPGLPRGSGCWSIHCAFGYSQCLLCTTPTPHHRLIGQHDQQRFPLHTCSGLPGRLL